MQVHYNLDDLPKFQNAVITIGTFDGVHLGHQLIISTLIIAVPFFTLKKHLIKKVHILSNCLIMIS